MHVVFVCTGNICRSAFAERYARLVAAQRGLDVQFTSVGVGAVVGASMDKCMTAELIARGGDPTGFVARQLDYDSISSADLLFPMEMMHRAALIEEYAALHRKAVVLGTAARFVADLPVGANRLEFLVNERVRSVRGDGVQDPYRRGAAAAAVAARQICRAIDTLLT